MHIEMDHPSSFIQDELDARGWSVYDLAVEMGGDAVFNKMAIDVYFIVGPTTPRMRVGDKMASQLEKAFGVPSEFFINLENAWLKRRLH